MRSDSTRRGASLAAFLFAAALTAATAAVPGRARADVLPLDVGELTLISDLVVEAQVLDARGEHAAGSIFIQTVTTLRADVVHKGAVAPGETLDVVTRGGRLDGQTTVAPESPVFTLDERCLLFLERRKGEWRVVGLAQGKRSLDRADELVTAVQAELRSGRVPLYRPIPGLPREKDDAWFAAARADGQEIPLQIENLREELRPLRVSEKERP
jgi:hypothetical protein